MCDAFLITFILCFIININMSHLYRTKYREKPSNSSFAQFFLISFTFFLILITFQFSMYVCIIEAQCIDIIYLLPSFFPLILSYCVLFYAWKLNLHGSKNKAIVASLLHNFNFDVVVYTVCYDFFRCLYENT